MENKSRFTGEKSYEFFFKLTNRLSETRTSFSNIVICFSSKICTLQQFNSNYLSFISETCFIFYVTLSVFMFN